MASDRPARLQIHQDLDFERRFGVFRRCGTGVLVLLVLAAMSGLLGSGPLARTEAYAGALKIDYPRFAHHGYPVWLEVRAPAHEGPLEVVLDGDLVKAFDLDHMAPAPEQAVLGEGQLLLRLAPGTTAVRLELTPREPGATEGHVSAGGDSARVRTFVYP